MPALNGGTYGVLALSYLITWSILSRWDLRGTSTSWQKCQLNNLVPKTKNTNQQELPPAKRSVWWAQGLWRLWCIRWVILMATALGNLPKHVDTKTTECRNKKWPANHQLVIPVLPWSISHSEPPIEHKVKKIRGNKGLIPNTSANS